MALVLVVAGLGAGIALDAAVAAGRELPEAGIGSMICAGLLVVWVLWGFLAFLVNLIATIGLRNVLSLFVPERWLNRQAAPTQA